jgi:hypothetical protein
MQIVSNLFIEDKWTLVTWLGRVGVLGEVSALQIEENALWKVAFR